MKIKILNSKLNLAWCAPIMYIRKIHKKANKFKMIVTIN